MKDTRDPSTPGGNYANGFSGYSYACPYVTNKRPCLRHVEHLPVQVHERCLHLDVNIPDRPWKTNPTKGHISGRVTIFGTHAWADGATVNITGPESRTQLCDGTGFYAFIDLTPGTYTISSAWRLPERQRQVTVAMGQRDRQYVCHRLRARRVSPRDPERARD